MKEFAIAVIGVLLIVIGAGYYFGWFDEIVDLIPWFADKGDLRVKVFDAMRTTDTSDDRPIANATVKILSTELEKKTDANGTVLFNGIEVGDYQVRAEYGSLSQTKNVTIVKNTITTITFLFNTS